MVFAGRPAVVVTAQDVTVRTRAETALVERTTLTTVSAEVGAALNRLGDLPGGMQGCAEAIVAHLDLAIVEISLINPATGAVEIAATAGDCLDADARAALTAGEWPLEVGDRSVGRMALFARTPFPTASSPG